MSDITGVAEKVVGFARLPRGWNYGSGIPAGDRSVVSALRVLDRLTQWGVSSADAFPGTGGEILVAAYRGQDCIEVMVEPDGRFNLTVELDGRDAEQYDGLTEAHAMSRLKDLIARLWTLSGSSTRSISIRNAANSQAWHSRTRQVAVPRSFPRIASRRAGFRFVATSTPTILNG